MKTIIVGGVAGGASAAARLRRLRETDEIILMEKGAYISYANCGLPYHISGIIESRKALTLQTPQSFSDRFRIDVRVMHEVLSVDPAAKIVTVFNHAENTTYQESFDNLVLSPGANATVPSFVSDPHDPSFFVLNSIPDMDAIMVRLKNGVAKTAVIIGGGFVGIEAAENLVACGLSVRIIELASQIINTVDWDIAHLAELELKKANVTVALNETVKSVVRQGDMLYVTTDRGSCAADIVICAVGVRPATAFLQSSGIKMDKRGAIYVDDRMQTSVPSVYAAGDAVVVHNFISGDASYTPLAGPANKQGRIAADQISGIDTRYKGVQGSAILKVFGKTLATTGLTEKNAHNYEKNYVSVKSHAGYYPDAEDLWLKLIFDKDSGALLGAQGFGGSGVDKRIDVFATAIRAHLTVSDIAELDLCYAPPYGSAKDPVNIAAYAAENIVHGLIPVVHGEHLAALDADKETVLDVRTEKERARGCIPNSLHIPLHELRGRMNELPKDKTYIVSCASGMRSYYACRILLQNGFSCMNLSGGYNLYHLLYEQR